MDNTVLYKEDQHMVT